MTSIFISYSRKDIETARKLTDAFKNQDLNFWIDWEGIPPTVDWWKEIEKGIEEADTFLFLISPDSAKSKVCRQEIEHAAKNGKRLIPIVVRNIEASESPTELRSLNWIFLRENDDFNNAFSKLITAIKTDYAWVQAHRQLQVKALEWARNNKENSFLLRGKELQDAELQLATNSSKEPHPTDLQREYALKSRQATDRQRRITTSIFITGVIALAALAVFGFVQADLATANAKEAQAVSTLAIANARTAEAASTLAVAEKATAQKNAKIALGRQLAAQAQSLNLDKGSLAIQSGLLAVEAGRLAPGLEADQALHRYLAKAGLPLVNISQKEPAVSVAFSPNGKYIVSQGPNWVIHVWDVTSGHEIAHSTSGAFWRELGFSSDSEYVKGVTYSGSICWWEVVKRKQAECINLSANSFFGPVSSDKKYITSGGMDGIARIWETAPGKEVAQFVHDGPIYAIDFTPDGKWLAIDVCKTKDTSGTFCEFGTIHVWEVTTKKEFTRITHKTPVYEIKISPDGKWVFSDGCNDGYCNIFTVHAWDIATGRETAILSHKDPTPGIHISPDGKYISTQGNGLDIRVWEIGSFREVTHISREGGQILFGSFSPNGYYYTWLEGTMDSLTSLHLTIPSIPNYRNIIMSHDDHINDYSFSADNGNIVTGSNDGTARVWETDTGKEIARATFDSPVLSVAFSPDGGSIVSGSLDGIIRIWNPTLGDRASSTTKYTFSTETSSPDGRYIIFEEPNGTAHVQEKATGKEIIPIIEHRSSWHTPIAFSPNSKYVMFGDGNRVQILEASTGKEIISLPNEYRVISVAFSPDGKYIVLSGEDNSFHIWEIQSGKEVSRNSFLEDTINKIIFSPDGEYVLLNYGFDEKILAQPWKINDLISETCKRLPRNFTHDEWNQYIGDTSPYQAVCPDLTIEPEITPTP